MALFERITPQNFEQIEVRERCPRIERIPGTGVVSGYALSKEVYSIRLHYANGHSRLCPGPQTCEFCKTHRTDIYGLLALWIKRKRRTIWAQLPIRAVTALMLGLRVLDRPLLGTFVEFEREWEGTNAPVKVSVPPTCQEELRLPKALTPELAIERTFFSPKVTGKPRPKAV